MPPHDLPARKEKHDQVGRRKVKVDRAKLEVASASRWTRYPTDRILRSNYSGLSDVQPQAVSRVLVKSCSKLVPGILLEGMAIPSGNVGK